MKRESAEEIALKTLAWLIGNEEILPIFLGSTGMSEADLRENLGNSDFLTAVLDFVTMNDDWVKECAQHAHLDPYDLMRARQALPGGEQINWT